MSKYSFSKKILKIYNLAKDKNPSPRRKIANTFGLSERLVKLLSPPFAYILNRFNVSADLVTIISFVLLIFGSIYFLIGDSLLGSIIWFIAIFLDSIDGDLARLNQKKTIYGNTLDSFGADIFYFIFPFVLGFYLFIYTSHKEIFFTEFDILIIAFIISFTLIGYRVIGLKRYILSLKEKKLKKIKHNRNFLNLKKTYNIIDNEIIRNNFFSEGGIVLNILIISIIQEDVFFYYYLLIISIYTSIRFFVSVFATYISFKKMKETN